MQRFFLSHIIKEEKQMKGQEKLKNLIREVINLIIKFFKPYGLSDEMLNIPRNVKRMGFKVGFMNLGMTIIALVFAFMLKATNMMIEHRLILLGIILFMLYRGQQVVRKAKLKIQRIMLKIYL